MSGRAIFICFIPLRNAAGETIAYASTDVAPDGLVPRVMAHAAPFKGDFLLFSGEGLLVQHARPDGADARPGRPERQATAGRR